MKYNSKKVSDLILIEQKNKKITLAELADKIGIAGGTLQKINARTSIPSIDSFEKIASYFNKDANYFFDLNQGERENIVKEETASYHKNLDWKEMYNDCKKELEKVHELLDMFKSGKITVNDPSKLDSKKCG